jgi:hypothetical protein
MMPAQTPSPTPADVPILTALATYHYLTAKQIRRLHYGPGVITYVRARLKTLCDAKFVTRLEQPHCARAGSAPNVFRLAARGYRFLEELDVPTTRLPGEKPHSYLYWRHTLALNDALIAAELLTRTHPDLTIHRLLHERELKHLPVTVRLPSGKERGVVPDAYLAIHEAEADGPGYWTNLVWEIDMGTREQRDWREKIQALLAYGKGPYQETLGATSLTIAVLAPQGAKRTAELVAWTEAELAASNAQAYGMWFCFTGLDPSQVGPDELYLTPVW